MSLVIEKANLYDYYIVPKEIIWELQEANNHIFSEVINKCKGFQQDKILRDVSKSVRYSVCKRQKWRCNNCGEKLKYNKESTFGNEVAHIDHIHPFSLRETYIHGPENINELSNLQALCPKCNIKLSNKKIK